MPRKDFQHLRQTGFDKNVHCVRLCASPSPELLLKMSWIRLNAWVRHDAEHVVALQPAKQQINDSRLNKKSRSSKT